MARPRQISNEEIIDAARTCFLEQGAQVSTSTIAERLGVSQAALFKRFGTKQELLFQAMLPPAIPPWVALVEHGPDDRPIPDQLREIALAIASFSEVMSPRMSVLKSSGCNMPELMKRFDVPPPVRGWMSLAAWIRTAQEQGRIRAGDPEAMSMMFLGAMLGRTFLTHVLGLNLELDPSHYTHELIETTWHGLAPSPVEEP